MNYHRELYTWLLTDNSSIYLLGHYDKRKATQMYEKSLGSQSNGNIVQMVRRAGVGIQVCYLA